MDMALIRAVFTNTLHAAEILGRADPVCAEIAAALPRLRPTRIGADGSSPNGPSTMSNTTRCTGICRPWSRSTR